MHRNDCGCIIEDDEGGTLWPCKVHFRKRGGWQSIFTLILLGVATMATVITLKVLFSG